ncbi:MAG: hypothetical protein IIB26_02295 [Chloroflexi bacterium]|nr:hypothetical protein [Chloroflexota bacterium]
MFRAIIILSVGLIVACSGGADVQVSPVATAVPLSTPASAVTVTPEPASDLAACITVLVFLAAAHTHPVDAITEGGSGLYAFFPDLTFRGISGLRESADMTIKEVLGRWCGEDIIDIDLFTELSVLITSDPTFK